MKRPRILLVLTEFPPSFGGMQAHAVALARDLDRHGYFVEVMTYRAGRKEAAAAEDFDKGEPYRIRRELSRLSYWANVEKIARAAKDGRAEAIYSSTVYYAQAGEWAKLPVLCRSAGNDVLRPWIAWPYRAGSGILDWPVFESRIYPWLRKRDWPEWCEGLLEGARWRLMRESAREMRHIAANSEYTRKALEALGTVPGQVSVEAGGVDVQLFRPGKAGEKAWRREVLGFERNAFLVFTACRLVEKKGLPLLLEAVAGLRGAATDRERKDSEQKVFLAIAGEGPERERLEARAVALGLEGNVRFLGRLDRAEMLAAYQAADVFVLPSQKVKRNKGGGRQVVDAETMGRVLCEAGACGLPVVAADSGGIASVVEQERNGLLFREGSARDLSAALRRLMRKPGLRRRLGQEGRRRAEQEFAWELLLQRNRNRILGVLSPRDSSIILRQENAALLSG